MTETKLLKALDLLRDGGFRTGPEHDAAHRICQDREGAPLHDWVHALVHRIEGDDANAAYWYRRAGRTRQPGTVEDEWRTIREAVEGA